MSRKPSIYLMPEVFQSQLRKTKRNINRCPGLYVALSTSGFLEGKLQSQNLQSEYLRTYTSILHTSHTVGSLESSEFT